MLCCDSAPANHESWASEQRLSMPSSPRSPWGTVSRRAVQPSNIPDIAFRYGVQIGQAFGLDFGIGFIRAICFVTFAIV